MAGSSSPAGRQARSSNASGQARHTAYGNAATQHTEMQPGSNPSLTCGRCVATVVAPAVGPAAAVPRPHAAAPATAAVAAAPVAELPQALQSCQGLAPKRAAATCRPAAPPPLRRRRQRERQRRLPPPPAATAWPLGPPAGQAGCGCATAALPPGSPSAAAHAQASERGAQGHPAAVPRGRHPCGALGNIAGQAGCASAKPVASRLAHLHYGGQPQSQQPTNPNPLHLRSSRGGRLSRGSHPRSLRRSRSRSRSLSHRSLSRRSSARRPPRSGGRRSPCQRSAARRSRLRLQTDRG